MRYAHILSRLINTPLAISQDKLSIITSNVVLPLVQGNTINSLPEEQIQERQPIQGMVTVFDSLVAKNGGGDSGSTSYYNIQQQVKYLIESGCTNINFYIDSPGGEVAGLFGLCSFISSLPTKYGITTRGFTDGSATSAAFAILSSCQERYATEGANLASIGVIMTLMDVTEADKKEGVKYTFLRSKEEKALFNPHETMDVELIKELTTVLMAKDKIFNNFIVNATGVSEQVIKDLKGKVILADEALKLNLITGIVSSFDEFSSMSDISKKKSLTKGNNAMTLEEALVQLSAKETELQATKAQVSLEIAKAKNEEKERCLTIIEAASTFMLPSSAAVKSIKSNASTEQTLMMFEIIKESQQIGNPVTGSVNLQPTANVNINESLTTQQLIDKAADALATANQAKRGLR
jgi:ClpP class serine protease